MSASIEEEVIEKLRVLPLEQQREVLAFVETLTEQHGSRRDNRSIWEVIREHSARVPAEEWDKVPTDGAEQHDHYLYGSPKKQS
jgi:hypothetical protein